MKARLRSAVLLAMVVAVLLPLAACTAARPDARSAPPASSPPATQSAPATPSTSEPAGSPTLTAVPVDKVMIVAEENKTYGEVLGSGEAPYLARLARTYGSALAMDAGYPPACPSLAAYVILTSGSDQGICDDRPPARHPLTADNVFRQVERSGRDWRGYAESMPAACATEDTGLYLVRHSPAPYYVPDRTRCRQWQVPLGTLASGALRDDVRAGRLPAYAFVSPNACNDMHGAAACPRNQVATGDAWLARWIPEILAGPDFRTGRLVVIVTWDEGSPTDNHIATLVVTGRTRGVRSTQAFTHCSTLRTVEEILALPLLGCAASATSMREAFSL